MRYNISNVIFYHLHLLLDYCIQNNWLINLPKAVYSRYAFAFHPPKTFQESLTQLLNTRIALVLILVIVENSLNFNLANVKFLHLREIMSEIF